MSHRSETRPLGKPTSGAPYRLVIFDFDGTLADSAGWFASVLNGVARRYRFRETSREQIETLRGEGPLEIMRALGVARWKVPLIARHMRKLMARDIGRIRPFPGIQALLADLHAANITLAIVSSNRESNIRAVLGPTAASIAHCACGASLFGNGTKFRAVLKATGVAPTDTLAIGDEIRNIDAAETLGITAAAVTWGYASTEALRARSPTVMFDTVEEIGPFVMQPHVAPMPTA